MNDRAETKLDTLVDRLRREGVSDHLLGEVQALRAGYRQMRVLAQRYRTDNERLTRLDDARPP